MVVGLALGYSAVRHHDGRAVAVIEELHLDLHQVVHRPGDEIKYLYFPVDCMISVTVTMSDGKTVEAGAAGSREVVGINAFMGGGETNQTEYIGQLAGKAMRIPAAPLRDEFDRNNSLRTLLLKFTQAYIAQISQNAACNRVHTLEERCARWLLEVRDRVSSDEFGLTQEFLSQMLGANRTTVSLTMVSFKDHGLIDYGRGDLHLLDIPALKRASCECYFVLQEEYSRLLGPSPNDEAVLIIPSRR